MSGTSFKRPAEVPGPRHPAISSRTTAAVYSVVATSTHCAFFASLSVKENGMLSVLRTKTGRDVYVGCCIRRASTLYLTVHFGLTKRARSFLFREESGVLRWNSTLSLLNPRLWERHSENAGLLFLVSRSTCACALIRNCRPREFCLCWVSKGSVKASLRPRTEIPGTPILQTE